MRNVKELIFAFFSALGCAALAADGDHLRFMPVTPDDPNASFFAPNCCLCRLNGGESLSAGHSELLPSFSIGEVPSDVISSPDNM